MCVCSLETDADRAYDAVIQIVGEVIGDALRQTRFGLPTTYLPFGNRPTAILLSSNHSRTLTRRRSNLLHSRLRLRARQTRRPKPQGGNFNSLTTLPLSIANLKRRNLMMDAAPTWASNSSTPLNVSLAWKCTALRC